LTGTEIILAPVGTTLGPGAEGFAGPDGTFKLADGRGHPRGVVPGEYRVGLRRPLRRDGTFFAERPKPEDPLGGEAFPMRLANASQSSLTLVIPPSGGEVQLDVPAELLTQK
jgi:hypothetical protein